MNYWLLLLIPLCAWLNRLRGTGQLFGLNLPFHPCVWVAPPMGVISYFSGVHTHMIAPWPWFMEWVGDYESAALFALCWLAWAVPGWGCIYRLGFIPPPDREPLLDERIFIWMGGGNLIIAFFWRMTICLIPMGLLFGLWWLALGPAITACYVLGWTIDGMLTGRDPAVPHYGIPWSEPIAGAAWGVAFVLFGAIG